MEGSWLPTLSAPYSPRWHRGNGTVHGAERTSSLRIQYLCLLRPVLIHGQGWGHASGTVSWNGFYRQPSGSDGEEVIHSIPNIENELLRLLLSQLRALIHFWKKIKKKKSHSEHCHMAILKYKVCIMPCHDTYYYGNIPFLQKDQFF